jgi:hypothetical protein
MIWVTPSRYCTSQGLHSGVARQLVLEVRHKNADLVVSKRGGICTVQGSRSQYWLKLAPESWTAGDRQGRTDQDGVNGGVLFHFSLLAHGARSLTDDRRVLYYQHANQPVTTLRSSLHGCELPDSTASGVKWDTMASHLGS